MRIGTLGPQICQNHPNRGGSESPEDPQELPRLFQGRQKKTQRRSHEPSRRVLAPIWQLWQVLWLQKIAIGSPFEVKIVFQSPENRIKEEKLVFWKKPAKPCFFLGFLRFLHIQNEVFVGCGARKCYSRENFRFVEIQFDFNREKAASLHARRPTRALQNTPNKEKYR